MNTKELAARKFDALFVVKKATVVKEVVIPKRKKHSIKNCVSIAEFCKINFK